MKGNSGHITPILTLALVGLLALASFVGIIDDDAESQEEQASSPVQAVVDTNLFQLGDGIDPTVPGLASITGTPGRGPDWDDLFNADGTLRDEYDADGVALPGGNGIPDAIDRFGGRAAAFISDDVSAGVHTDRTVLDGAAFSVVAAQEDLGNSYAYLTTDAEGRLVLFGGLERLTADSGQVELELNQKAFKVREGNVVGERTPGDVLIRLTFDKTGAVETVELLEWRLAGDDSESNLQEVSAGAVYDFVLVETLNGEGCTAETKLCAVSNADSIAGGSWPSFDASGNRVEQLAPGTFIELGVNLGMLQGPESDDDYTGTQTRSIADIALGEFEPGPISSNGVSEAPCIKQVPDIGSITCTANDVRIGTLEVVGDPLICDPASNDLFEVELKATIISGPERYDIGLWINQSGGSAQDDADGTCYREILTPQGTFPTDTTHDCNSLGGPYANGDDDSCGDIPKTQGECANTVQVGNDLLTEFTFTAFIRCTDTNLDGQVDAGACTSWSQNPNEITCGGVLDAIPGSPAKCECDTFEIGGIFSGCMTNDDCDDGIACTDDVCTVEGNVGTCSNTPNNGFCDDGNVCTTDSCDPNADPGSDGCVNTPVDDPINFPQCLEGGCVPSLCPTDGECTEGTCNTDGTCGSPAPLAAGTACGDPTDDQCNNPDTCDGAGTCVDNFEPATTSCEDGLFCTSTSGTPGAPDNCNGQGNDGAACVGGPVDCDDGEFCNGVETCDDDLDQCVSPGDPCPGTECNTCQEDTDSCFDPSGSACGDPTDDQCNNPDTCDGAGTCVDNFEPAATTCEDGFFCTSTSGTPGAPDNCNGQGNDGAACVGGPVDCDDGEFCNGVETCDDDLDQCVSPGDPCPGTECNTCQEDTDSCFDPSGSACGDPTDDQCNNPDTCDGAGTCVDNFEPAATTCEDGFFCTSTSGTPGAPDNCNGQGNDGAACVGGPVDCDDGEFCNGVETCDDDLDQCVSPGDPCPGTECNTCQEDTDSCFDPSGSACGDPTDDQCNNPDTCDGAGTCVDNFEPAATTCEDGFFCTSTSGTPGAPDNCNGQGNDGAACVGGPVDCDDGEFCNGVETCDDDLDQCVSPGDPCPGTECNTCQEDTDSCFDPSGSACGDPTDDQCNNPDTCDGAGTCVDNFEPAATTCEDGFFCTSTSGTPGAPDNCNGQGNDGAACVGGPVDCDDGEFCNGVETCDDDLDQCVSPGDPCPGTECNTCQEDTDSCFDPSGSACGDPTDDQCNNPDTCDGAGTCVDNFEPAATTCEDGFFCTSTSGTPGAPDNCNGQGNDGAACVGGPVDCDDGEFCNGVETCDDDLDQCVSPGDPCPGTECNTCQEDTDSCFDPSGSACGDPTDDQCNNPDTCDGAGTCVDNFEPAATTCEDGFFCTSTSGTPGDPDNCNGQGNDGAACVGGPVNCDDGLFCTGTEVCNDVTDTCDSSGDPCPGTECNTCQEGTDSCFDPVGTACGDSSDDQCDNPDTCDGSGTCDDNLEPDGTSCDDGLSDTCGDECTTGECAGTVPQPRTQGYWHRQCLGLDLGEGGIDPGREGQGPSEPNYPGGSETFIALRDQCEDDVIDDLFLDALDLTPSQGPGAITSVTCRLLETTPPSNQCERARKQLTALILNVCSGKLTNSCLLDPTGLPEDSDCGFATTVGELIEWGAAQLDLIEGNEGDFPGSCNEVAQCAAAVNEGPGVGVPEDSEFPSPAEGSLLEREDERQIRSKAAPIGGRRSGGRR